MGVLIDPPSWPAHGRLWSHLASDTSFDELHVFAGRLGVPQRAFEGDHYDVPQERYDGLVAAGALPVASRELLRALQRNGLRRTKRKDERVLASLLVDGPARWDLIASPLPAPVPATCAVLALAPGPALLVAAPHVTALLATPADGAFDLPSPGQAERAGADVTAAHPCGHERTAPVGLHGVELGRATWRTVLRADVRASPRLDDSGDVRWLPLAAVREQHPRWWPLVEYVTTRR